MTRWLLLALLFFALTACSDDDKEPGATTVPASPDAGTQPPGGPTTVTPAPADTPTPPPTSDVPTPAACAAASLESGKHTIESGGEERTYRLHLPERYNDGERHALVLNYHGLGGSADAQEGYSSLLDDADAAGFVLVTPQATGFPTHWRTGASSEDVVFTQDLLDTLAGSLCINPQRVYLVGISNGAEMVSQLVCVLPERIAAVAMVAGASYAGACDDTAPVPVIAFHGTDDAIIPFGGRRLLGTPAISDVMERWAAHNACQSGASTEAVSEDATLETYGSCAADVSLYVIEGGGHAWPGSDEPKALVGRTTQTIDAAALIWAFFSDH